MRRVRAIVSLAVFALLLPGAGSATRAATLLTTPSPVPTAAPKAVPTATTTPAVPLKPPKPGAALRRSITAMRSVHQIHAEAHLRGGNAQHAGANLKISGDCVASVSATHTAGKLGPSRVRADLWTRGRLFQPPRPATPVDDHLIVIGTNKSGQVWERSAQTRNVWQKAGAKPTVGASYLAEMCPQFLAAFAVGDPPKHLRNRGLLTIRGIRTWHLQSREVTGESVAQRVNIYVSLTTFYWVRFTVRQLDGAGRTTALETFDYSGFNQPVTIARPRLGSPTP